MERCGGQAMKAFAFDTETDLVRHDTPVPRCVLVSIYTPETGAQVTTPEEGRTIVLDLARRGLHVIGHRTAFDLAVLGIKREDLPNGFYDTNIRGVLHGAANGQHESQSNSLADLARNVGVHITGKGTTQLSFDGLTLDQISPEQRRYAAMDAEATYRVWVGQGGPKRAPGEEWQTERTLDVWAMGRRGIPLDVDLVGRLKENASLKRDLLHAQLVSAGIITPRGPKKNPWRDSAVDQKKVQDLLERAGAKGTTATGKLESDAATLRATGWPVLEVLADFKDVEKRISLIDALDVGPIARANWKSMVASGRISCSGPNLTQVPKKGGLRECIYAPRGKKLVTADFSSLEYRCFADVAYRMQGYSNAREYLLAGKDPHCVVAAQILGVPYEEALANKKTGRYFDARQHGKGANYGLLGGMGARKFAEISGITEAQARSIITAWKLAHPEHRPHFASITPQGEMYRARLPWSGRVRVAYYSEALNFYIQGTGSDVAKEALRRSEKLGLPCIGLVHDELMWLPDAHDAEEVGRLGARCMVEAGLEVCPNVPWEQDYEVLDRWPSKG